MGEFIIPLLFLVLILTGCGGKNEIDQEADTMNTHEETVASDLKRVGGEDIATSILAGEYERLYVQFSDELKNIVKLEEFRSIGQEFVASIDTFRLTSQIKLNGTNSLVWEDQTGLKGLSASIDETGTITGIQIINHTPHPETDVAHSKTIFNFPFEEEWLVYWGGNNVLSNYHYDYENMRYAYDLVKENNGYSYEGDPKLNESYFAFNEDVLAPADGVVVAAVDGISDNEPVGKMNEAQPFGNVVTIKHSNGEFSTIAHLKNGSVLVKAGDTVTAGQLIGKCGNSGNSSEAHIHFQVSAQSGEAGMVNNIPISFKDSIQPIRGDHITGEINDNK